MTDAALHVHRYGDPAGTPLIALHGIAGHGARWRRITERHLENHRVLAPDLRGHGGSPYNPPWGVERHVEDVLALMDAEAIQQADLVGHSYGGMISVRLARTAPERIRRLVLLDPAIGLDPARAGQRAREYMRAESFADQDEARAVRAARWPEAPDGAVDDEVRGHLQQDPAGRWRWRIEPAAVVTAYSEMARPHVTPPPGLPTHLVIATRADLVQPEFVADCRAALGPDLTITEIDSGHMLYFDRLEETGSLLRDWLGR